MTRPILITTIFAIFLLLMIIGIDIYFAVDKIKGNTWSEIIRLWGEKYKLIPFAWGMLAGHFFHPTIWPHFSHPNGIAVLLWVAVVMQILSSVSPLPMLIYLGIGTVAGIFCWPV
jgi:hypothetical protein